jgi:hypothetical protein
MFSGVSNNVRAEIEVRWCRKGNKITLPGHGPQDLTKKQVTMILRHLEAAGFDKDQIRHELDM